jgi:hypothetical protein
MSFYLEGRLFVFVNKNEITLPKNKVKDFTTLDVKYSDVKIIFFTNVFNLRWTQIECRQYAILFLAYG